MSNQSNIMKPLYYHEGTGENIILVKLTINSKDYDFLLDTGSSGCIIHSDYKQELVGDKPPVGFDEMMTGYGEVRQIDIYEIPLFVNEWMFIHPFIVANIDALYHTSEITKQTVVGIIGMDFLLKTKAFLDFKQLKIQYNEYNNPSI